MFFWSCDLFAVLMHVFSAISDVRVHFRVTKIQIIAERALTVRFQFRIRIRKEEDISGTRTVGR